MTTAPVALTKRQRHLIRRWARGNRHQLLKCREIEELKRLGLIEWINGSVEGGGYAAFPVLSELGIAAVGNGVVRVPTIKNVFVDDNR